MFVIIGLATIGLDSAIPRNWVSAGKGTITNVEETGHTFNERRTYAYHFETADDGSEKINGISYGTFGKHKVGDGVSLEKAGERYRVQGLAQAPGGALLALLLFGIIPFVGMFGLGFPLYLWLAGGKAIHLLQDGTATSAKYVGMNHSGISANKVPVMKVNFEYQVDEKKYTASVHAVDTSRFTDAEYRVVFYDPIEPKRSVVWDGLPRGLRIDELTRRFGVNPLRYALPLLAATLVCGEIIAIIVLAIRAI